MTYPVPVMNDALEPMIKAMKDILEDTGLFALINEGEEVYDGGVTAWVIPGPIKVIHKGMSQLQLDITVYVIAMSSDPDTTPAELRKQLNPAYDELVKENSLNGTCWSSIPTLWHPGFLQMGEVTYVGIQGQWFVRIMQAYSPQK